MFEISWSELLILAVVTLVFVGPKDLPKFLSTMGRYAGMVRRQAAEFRAQFDEAMRQAELDALKKEVNDLRSGVETSLNEAQAAKPATQVPTTQTPATQTPATQTPATQAPAPGPPPLTPSLPLGRSAQEIAASSQGPADGASAPLPPLPAKSDDKAGG